MALSIIFQLGAESELAAAYDWYETNGIGLGSEFMRCVEACVRLVQRHPQIFPVIRNQVRRATLRRFPYSIFYIPTSDAIVIISVFHSSREPKRWVPPET